jgi:hypothetical protein
MADRGPDTSGRHQAPAQMQRPVAGWPGGHADLLADLAARGESLRVAVRADSGPSAASPLA